MNKASAFSLLIVLGAAFFANAPSMLPPSPLHAVKDGDEVLGVGIVRPRLLTGVRLYFYNMPQDFNMLEGMAMPVDSIVFGEGRHHVPITYAPPWFLPEYMNLDYDALLLRAVTVSRNWIEVVVNTSSPRPRMFPHTFWVARERVEFSYWPDFLLNVAAVEVLEAKANPVRIAPNEQASVVSTQPRPLLRPLAIQGTWMHVAVGEGPEEAITGWIRWRSSDQLLIAYSLTM